MNEQTDKEIKDYYLEQEKRKSMGNKSIELKAPYRKTMRGSWKITEIEEGRIFEQNCTGRLVFVPIPQPPVRIHKIFYVLGAVMISHLIDRLVKTE